MRWAWWLSVFVACSLGCSPTAKKTSKHSVSMDSVPPEIIKVAQTTMPDVVFDNVVRGDGFYEVRGKNKSGKIIEVEVSDEGKVLEIE